MIAEGKEVNTDLALPNAIQFLTIVEAFNATGLIKSNSETYNTIVKESGLYRQPKADMKLAQNIEHRFADIDAKSVPERKENEKPKSKVTKTFQQWKAEKEKNAAINASNKAENKAVKESVVQYTNDNTKFYTKTQLAIIFETIGYDLNRDDFDLIAESLGYKQIVK